MRKLAKTSKTPWDLLHHGILNLCFLLSILASLRPCVLKGRSTGSPEILVTQGRLPLRTIRGRFFRRRAASYL